MVTLLTAATLVAGGVLADDSGAAEHRAQHQARDERAQGKDDELRCGVDPAGERSGGVGAVGALVPDRRSGVVGEDAPGDQGREERADGKDDELRAVLRRSAVVTADADTDRLLRRASVARACRALAAGSLVTLGADLFVAGAAAARAFDDGGWHGVAVSLMAAGPFLVLAGLVALVLPVPRLPATPVYTAATSTSVPMGSA